MREGTRSSLTTAWPRAASVHAIITARISASRKVMPGSTTAPASAPATIVNGRPMPSRRTGTPSSPRRAPSEMRDASEKSTRVRVASASSLTGSLRSDRSMTPSQGPRISPAAVKKMAGVTGLRASFFEPAAYATRQTPPAVRAHALTGLCATGEGGANPALTRRELRSRSSHGARKWRAGGPERPPAAAVYELRIFAFCTSNSASVRTPASFSSPSSFSWASLSSVLAAAGGASGGGAYCAAAAAVAAGRLAPPTSLPGGGRRGWRRRLPSRRPLRRGRPRGSVLACVVLLLSVCEATPRPLRARRARR